MEDAVTALQHAGNASVQLAINFLEQEAISEVLPWPETVESQSSPDTRVQSAC